MLTFVAIVHILIAILLIAVVLLQDSKGGAMGMLGGGASSNSVFGSTGAVSFLVKATRWLAIALAATCIYLASYSTRDTGTGLMDKHSPAPAPSTEVIDTSKALEEATKNAPAAGGVEQKAPPVQPQEPAK